MRREKNQLQEKNECRRTRRKQKGRTGARKDARRWADMHEEKGEKIKKEN